jgi:hypothetical protein
LHSGFSDDMLYASLMYSTHATRSAHLILL